MPHIDAIPSISENALHEIERAAIMMLTPKRLPKPLSAAMAHLDELLDEALKDTFPASDPVAINVEIEPPEHETTTGPGSRASHSREQGAPGRLNGLII